MLPHAPEHALGYNSQPSSMSRMITPTAVEDYPCLQVPLGHILVGPVRPACFLVYINSGALALGMRLSAVFHPPGASLAARVSEGKGSGLRLSIFVFGGMMGFAVGPLVAVAMVARVGLEGLWMAMFPGILVAALLLVILPRGRGD